jgi:hypothetical protein
MIARKYTGLVYLTDELMVDSNALESWAQWAYSQYCAPVSSQGDLIVCDFSRYVVAMRESLRTDVSIHVKFLTDEVALRFIMRVNGQPIDRTPVTRLNDSTTLSAFVSLQAR